MNDRPDLTIDPATFARLEVEIRERRAREADDRRWRALAPSRFVDATLASVIDRPGGDEIADWSAAPAGRNLIICGPIGTGKTHAAMAAVRPHVESGVDVRFWPTVELLDQLRPGGDDGVLEAAMACTILVLDDLGVERATDWTLERMYAIVNRRWMDAKSVVVTTNSKSSTDLADQVGERMSSRLAGSGAVIVRLAGHDRRREP